MSIKQKNSVLVFKQGNCIRTDCKLPIMTQIHCLALNIFQVNFHRIYYSKLINRPSKFSWCLKKDMNILVLPSLKDKIKPQDKSQWNNAVITSIQFLSETIRRVSIQIIY